MNYKQKQYDHVINLIEQNHIFNGDKGNGIFRNKSYPFILENNQNNLYSEIREDCEKYFSQNHIAWWNGGLTNHPLSSQVACLNHLFPFRCDAQAVLDIIRKIEPNITEVLPIQSKNPSDTVEQSEKLFIQFEVISDHNHLNEKNSTRGSFCTSIDALIYGKHRDGRKFLFPIEWKYVENYSNSTKILAAGEKTRIQPYSKLIDSSIQLNTNNSCIYSNEPFYQLMRQTLWAEQMIAHKDIETIKADDFIHIHVIPDGNHELLAKIYKCSDKAMSKSWYSCLKNKDKYILRSPQSLLAPIQNPQYQNLLFYLKERYWK